MRSICLSAAAIALVTAGAAAGQTADPQSQRIALGSRIGDREQDVNKIGLSGDQRVSRRVNQRLNTRLQTRLDRFGQPLTDWRDAYTPLPDDTIRSR